MTKSNGDTKIILAKLEQSVSDLKGYIGTKFDDLHKHQEVCRGQFNELYDKTNGNKNKLSSVKVYISVGGVIILTIIGILVKMMVQ